MAGGRLLNRLIEHSSRRFRSKDGSWSSSSGKVAGLWSSYVLVNEGNAGASWCRANYLRENAAQAIAYQRLWPRRHRPLSSTSTALVGRVISTVFSGVCVVETPGRFYGLCVYFRALLIGMRRFIPPPSDMQTPVGRFRYCASKVAARLFRAVGSLGGLRPTTLKRLPRGDGR